jgi:serine phosphatase RsbU (regulator of sigma subunit)
MDEPDFGSILRALHELSPTDVPDSLASVAGQMGVNDLTAYLIDFEQSTLFPIPDRGAHIDSPIGVAADGTQEGQAFLERRLVEAVRDDGTTRVCVPIIEGSDCTGALAFTVLEPLDERAHRGAEELGMLVGAAIAIAARYTDLFNLVRRRRAMSLPASIQWDLLPPLRLITPEASSNGVLEPAYDVGGDCFDHSVNGYSVDVAIMDAMGHGLDSSIVSSLAVQSYRHDRREGRPLAVIHDRLDRVLGENFGGERFVTGQLATLDVRSGHLRWTNAGHPRPLHVRADRVLAALPCRPSRPWGLGGDLREEAEERLQPGDSVVFYTDGVVEGRAPSGEPFGLDRFVDLIERASAARVSADIILRNAINGVLEFQQRRLRDDATIVWLTWNRPPGGGEAVRAAVPSGAAPPPTT